MVRYNRIRYNQKLLYYFKYIFLYEKSMSSLKKCEIKLWSIPLTIEL